MRLSEHGARRLTRRMLPFLSALLLCSTVAGQTTLDRIQEHIRFGEFPAAIALAETLDGNRADQALSWIADAQFESGARHAGMQSVASIRSDAARTRFLANRYQAWSGGSDRTPPRPPAEAGGDGGRGLPAGGSAGGITEQDFEPLIDLIQSVIAPESWEDVNGDGTIMAYPSGVYVDSQGMLHRLKMDSNRRLKQLRPAIRNDSGNRTVLTSSDLRKISLNRLERAVQLRAAQGLPPDPEMQNLAGMYQITYLTFIPETEDVVVVGPAGPWRLDETGRAVNVKTGLPTLQLDDLVVCLRNTWENDGKYGCKITPRRAALVATQEFLATSTLRGAAWRKQLRRTLGHQDVEVFGIDPKTHAGRVLVEADYRMKLVGMGLEPGVPGVPSYLDRLQAVPGDQGQPMDVVRWWFTMNYDELLADRAGRVYTFTGTGVRVLSENELLDAAGRRIHTGQAKGPTAGFARDFTDHFEAMSRRYPIYRELKNLFDLSIVSALIRNQRLAEQVGWELSYFAPRESSGDFVYQPRRAAIPRQVDSVMNHRVLTERDRGRTLKHTLVGVSGGVSFDAMQFARADNIEPLEVARTTEGKVDPETTPEFRSVRHWWWD